AVRPASVTTSPACPVSAAWRASCWAARRGRPPVMRSSFIPVLTGGEREREGPGAADLTSGPGDLIEVGERELGDAFEPGLHGDAELHAGQVGTEASVDAHTEREVPVDVPVEDDLVGTVEDLGVGVAGWERQEQPVALAHRAPADLG